MAIKQQQRADLVEALRANRRMCALLDREVRELEVLLQEDDLPDGGEYPTWFGAIGADGNPGFLIGDVDTTPLGFATFETDGRHFQGRIQLDSDAPFVWTGVLATARWALEQNTTPAVLQAAYQGIQGGHGVGGNLRDDQFPDIRLGFVEAGSGRELFQAQENAQTGVLLSSEMLNTQRLYGAFQNMGATAPGHGPNEPFMLPSKTVLPANDVIFVDAQAAYFNMGPPLFPSNLPLRLFVTLLGYKIFGD